MNPSFSTRAVESGIEGLVVPPYDTGKAQPWDKFGVPPNVSYSRSCSDNSVQALESKVASLHDDKAKAVVFASGQACTSTLLSMARGGSHIICAEQVYGSTRIFIEQYLKGVSYSFVEPTRKNLEAVVRKNTEYLLLETPTNPLLSIVDLEEVQRFASEHNVKLILDNTFATMFLLDGFKYGAHVVYYSMSKYFGGHHDTIGGVIVTKDYDLIDKLITQRDAIRKMYGGIISPDVAYRINTQMQTLPLRMRKQCDNAMVVAEYLSNHPQVSHVYYPGLKNHPGHEIAARQMKAADGCENKYGGVVSFEVKGDFEEFANFFAKNKRVVYLMESLGSNVTILANPTTMSHKGLTGEQRQKLGIKPNLFRLSSGISDVKDIINTLEEGFRYSKKNVQVSAVFELVKSSVIQ